MKKKLIKIGTLLLTLALVFVCAAMAACGGGGDDQGDKGNPSPAPEHTHTYATTWSKDDTHHWHAATCEHKTETKDKAAHVISNGTCSVCGYEEPKAALCTHDECPKCPDCGGCLDERCTIEGCIPCGHDLTKHTEFEASYAELSAGRNPADPDEAWPLKPADHRNCKHKDELGFLYIPSVQGNNGGKITFKITSDKATTVTLRVRCAKNNTKTILTEGLYFIVNNELLERETFVNPPTTDIKAKEDFDWNNLGCIDLVAGENIIQIVAYSADPNVGYNMQKIDIVSGADVNLTWNPRTLEENNADICTRQ